MIIDSYFLKTYTELNQFPNKRDIFEVLCKICPLVENRMIQVSAIEHVVRDGLSNYDEVLPVINRVVRCMRDEIKMVKRSDHKIFGPEMVCAGIHKMFFGNNGRGMAPMDALIFFQSMPKEFIGHYIKENVTNRLSNRDTEQLMKG